MIVIVDGLKRVCKSTVIDAISKVIPNSIIYNDRKIFPIANEMKSDVKMMLISQLYLASLVKETIIFDRMIISEYVYGRVYRESNYIPDIEIDIINKCNGHVFLINPPLERIIKQQQIDLGCTEKNIDKLYNELRNSIKYFDDKLLNFYQLTSSDYSDNIEAAKIIVKNI